MPTPSEQASYLLKLADLVRAHGLNVDMIQIRDDGIEIRLMSRPPTLPLLPPPCTDKRVGPWQRSGSSHAFRVHHGMLDGVEITRFERGPLSNLPEHA